VLNIERASYLLQFENGVLGSEAFGELETFMSELNADVIKIDEEDITVAVDRKREQLLLERKKKSEATLEKVFEQCEEEARVRQQLRAHKLQRKQSSMRAFARGAVSVSPEANVQSISDPLRAVADASGPAYVPSAPIAQKTQKRLDGKTSMAQRLSDMYDCHFNEMLATLLKRKRPWRLKVAYEIGLAYLEAIDEVRHATHGKAIFDMVAREHEDNRESMVRGMTVIQKRLPGLIFEFKRHYCASLVLHHQHNTVEHMHHEGNLTDLDSTPMLQKIDQHLKNLYLEPVYDSMEQVGKKVPATKYIAEPTKHLAGRFASVRVLVGLDAAPRLMPALRGGIKRQETRKLAAGGDVVRLTKAVTTTLRMTAAGHAQIADENSAASGGAEDAMASADPPDVEVPSAAASEQPPEQTPPLKETDAAPPTEQAANPGA